MGVGIGHGRNGVRGIPFDPVFRTTWKTDNAGTSNGDQITLPLPDSGSYDFEVRWGDGTSDRITSASDAAVTHTYPSPGTYTVEIEGRMTAWKFEDGGDKLKVQTVENWGAISYEQYVEAWHGCWNVVFNADDVPDTSRVTNFLAAWQDCRSLTSFPQLDVSQATSFSYVWRDCRSLTSFPQLDVSRGTDFIQAWRNCYSLTSFPQLDVSRGTDFLSAWRDCRSLTSFPQLDVSTGTDFRHTWRGCPDLPELPDLPVGNGTDFENVVAGSTELDAIGFQNASADLPVPDQNMDGAALDDLYTDLADVRATGGATITVTGNPGVGNDDQTIATNKGWTVES
jgi:hypothetical protein